MNRGKYRIRFRKADDLRFLSHHDLLRLFERMLRRAQLPFRSSEGFHPLPKMAFASALGLGIVGLQEIVDIEMTEELPAESVRERLAEQSPPGLTILSAEAIKAGAKAQACRACYRLALDPAAYPELQDRMNELLASPSVTVERLKPERRSVDIRPFLRHLRLEADGVILDFTVTPNGSARPDEVLGLLGLGEVVERGGVIERVLLELEETNAPQPANNETLRSALSVAPEDCALV